MRFATRFFAQFVLLATASGVLVGGAHAPRQTTVYFDDSRGDLMVLGNPTYEVAFRKSNGAIAYVTDKSTGQHVSEGSRDQCLWRVDFRGSVSASSPGNSHDVAGAGRFGYAWMPDTNTLRLSYDPDPLASRRVSAEVLVTASDGTWFDMRLHLENHSAGAINSVHFPSDLAFVEDDIQALLPLLPGVVLERRFFAEHRTYTTQYPGYPGVFADYLALSSNRGRVALYSIHHGGPISPTIIGFVHDDQSIAAGTLMRHAFGTDVGDGKAWDSAVVRVRISEPFADTVCDYRVDNALDRMPSLQQKLGPRYTQVVQSPLYKANAVRFRMPFERYTSILASLPSPGILHPVAFQPGGHDHNSPDYLPPASAFGSTSDFARMCREAQAAGLLVMPYTNPTWWHDASPTLRALPPGVSIEDLAVLDENGRPRYETYDAGGYAMSPFAPFVKQRLGELVEQMTVTVPSDLLFEDQIGARPWLFDYNRHSVDASTYMDGWLEHTRAYSDRLLMTELGFDRLVETEVGFTGGVLLPERTASTTAWWGTGNWHVFPLAPMMTRDKVLFYQHDLAPETMSTDTVTLKWNLAFGYMLNFEIEPGGANPFLALAAAFQKNVLALYASERITKFENLNANVTRTSFESFKVTANWDDSTSFSDGAFTLPPGGVMTRSDDATVTAGVFWTFNGVPLSPGHHYLIERRERDGISIYQPIGSDTRLTVKLPAGWNPSESIVGWASNSAGTVLGRVPLSITADGIRFTWRRYLASRDPRTSPERPDDERAGSRSREAARSAARRDGAAGDQTNAGDRAVYAIRIERRIGRR